MKILFIIPARGGSKGIPGKNIKNLNGKPLIHYSIDLARQFTNDENICLSTDNEAIKENAEQHGLIVPFVRPAELAQDASGTHEVLIHALGFYESKGQVYDMIVLLQPTSPFRQVHHVSGAIDLYTETVDMVVSVKETASNPYYSLVEENVEGYLEKSKKGNFVRRQDCPPVYEYNGAVYVINVVSLKRESMGNFKRIKKYVMDSVSSLDLDTLLDWDFAEFLYKKGVIK